NDGGPRGESRPAAPQPTAPRASGGGKPSISVSITPGSGASGMLEEARRQERLGDEAARRRSAAEAQGHYVSAGRIYEALARQGGTEGGQARERLEALRKALASLR